jgi:hypothetical protein
MNDSISYHTNHSDTIINGDHIVIDTFISHDTVYVEKNVFHEEIKIIDKLIDRPDFGSSAVSVLIVIFVIYSIWKTRNKNK